MEISKSVKQLYVRRSGERDDLLAEGANPCDAQLPGGAVLLGRHGMDRIDETEIGRQVLISTIRKVLQVDDQDDRHTSSLSRVRSRIQLPADRRQTLG